MLGLVQGWAGGRSKARFEEVPGQDHWWDEAFKSPSVAAFLDDNLLLRRRGDPPFEALGDDTFTLTVSNPAESGSLKGFGVLSIEEGGR